MKSNIARMEVIMRKLANTLWGIVLVIIGVILTLNALDITNINIFFNGWWTLLIIIPSAIELIARENKFLPEWASAKLEQLSAHQSQQHTYGMNGMNMEG